MFSRAKIASAVTVAALGSGAAVAATIGSKPSRASAFENGPEMLDSSSTNKTLGRGESDMTQRI